MSHERRHELEKNELAILLDRANKAIEPYSKGIALGLGILFVAAIGWLFYRSQASGQRSDSTLQLIEASASQDPEVLREVSVTYPGTTSAAWAQLYQGQLLLADGIQAMYRDRVQATEQLTEAKTALSNAIAGSDDPLLRSRAQLGLARAEESLGNLDAAKEAYQQVITIAESEAVIKLAEQRIAALDDPQTEEFLAWFGDQDFAPADPSLPPSLEGVGGLPDTPDVSFPDLSAGEGETEPAGEAETEPAGEAETEPAGEAADPAGGAVTNEADGDQDPVAEPNSDNQESPAASTEQPETPGSDEGTEQNTEDDQ